MSKIVIDGMLSGTGVRDKAKGGYIDPRDLGLSQDIRERLRNWVDRYENAHYNQYRNEIEVELLDREGVQIAREIRLKLLTVEVGYFSDAKMEDVPLDEK